MKDCAVGRGQGLEALEAGDAGVGGQEQVADGPLIGIAAGVGPLRLGINRNRVAGRQARRVLADQFHGRPQALAVVVEGHDPPNGMFGRGLEVRAGEDGDGNAAVGEGGERLLPVRQGGAGDLERLVVGRQEVSFGDRLDAELIDRHAVVETDGF